MISVFAWRGESEEDFWWCIERCISSENWQPNMVLDDGGDATHLLVKKFNSIFRVGTFKVWYSSVLHGRLVFCSVRVIHVFEWIFNYRVLSKNRLQEFIDCIKWLKVANWLLQQWMSMTASLKQNMTTYIHVENQLLTLWNELQISCLVSLYNNTRCQ